MSEIAITPVIAYMINKKSMIFCDFLEMRNNIVGKYMACGQANKTITIY